MSKRTYQEVRSAVDTAMGTLSCNWCFMPKPADQVRDKMRANGRKGKICASCEAKIKERHGKK